MFNQYTYKQKFGAIIIGFIILLLASYKKTFRHAIAAKKQLNIVENKLRISSNSYDDIAQLKNEIITLDNIIGGNKINPELVQQSLLDFITRSNINVNIVSIEDVHMFSADKFLIHTNQIELEGAYSSLIKLLYAIEREFKDSRVISSQLYSKKNYRTNTTKLLLKIILQNYEKI